MNLAAGCGESSKASRDEAGVEHPRQCPTAITMIKATHDTCDFLMGIKEALEYGFPTLVPVGARRLITIVETREDTAMKQILSCLALLAVGISSSADGQTTGAGYADALTTSLASVTRTMHTTIRRNLAEAAESMPAE